MGKVLREHGEVGSVLRGHSSRLQCCWVENVRGKNGILSTLASPLTEKTKRRHYLGANLLID